MATKIKKQKATFLVKVCDSMKKDSVELIGGFGTMDGARVAANDYEKTLNGKEYKREFCVYDEPNGIHKGFCFTIF